MQHYGPLWGPSDRAWQAHLLRRQHLSVALCSLRLLAATAFFSGTPAHAAQHEPGEAAPAANTFLLRPGATFVQRRTPEASWRPDFSYDRVQLAKQLTKRNGVVQDWVWWGIIVVVALMLVFCFLWLFCLRGRSSPTPNATVTKPEDANGTPKKEPSQAAKHNGSPPTPVKTPLAILTAASRSSSEQLCPTLVVPESEEIRFALMQNIFGWTPRPASKVLDNNGQVIANVEGTCIGNDRMALRGPKDDLLCEVQRRSLDFADQTVFDIFHAHGQLFGVLEKDTLNPIFSVTSASGARLLIFQGDFRRKEIDITEPNSGDQLAQTGHGFFSFGRIGHYQVRVAGGVDAGLIMACCLAIDEAEA